MQANREHHPLMPSGLPRLRKGRFFGSSRALRGSTFCHFFTQKYHSLTFFQTPPSHPEAPCLPPPAACRPASPQQGGRSALGLVACSGGVTPLSPAASAASVPVARCRGWAPAERPPATRPRVSSPLPCSWPGGRASVRLISAAWGCPSPGGYPGHLPIAAEGGEGKRRVLADGLWGKHGRLSLGAGGEMV